MSAEFSDTGLLPANSISSSNVSSIAADRSASLLTDQSPGVSKGTPNTSYKWAILGSNPSNAYTDKFNLNDPFWNFTALDSSDFRFPYSYEFVVYDEVSGTVIDSIVLPIAPQAITITTVPAINTTVTMKGIVEEHNSAPLRNISIKGTMGVMPVDIGSKGTQSSGTAIQSYLNTIFKNTIQSVNIVANQVNNVVNAFAGGGTPINSKLNYTTDVQLAPDVISGKGILSGYYYIHQLERFFDAYLAVKATKKARGYRLVFQMHKDQMYYDCSLGPYTIDKAAGSVEYTYSIQLVAFYRRPKPAGTTRALLPANGSRTPSQANQLNKLQAIFNTLQQTRQLLFAAYNVIGGISADINDSFVRPLNDINMIIKDTLNLPMTMADFITGNSKNSFFPGAYQTMVAGASSLPPSLNDQIKQAGFSGTSSAGGGSAYTAAQISQAQSGMASTTAGTAPISNPLQSMLNSPMQHAAIFDQVPLDSLPLTAAAQDYVDGVLSRVRSLTINDFQNYRDSLSTVQATVSSVLGGSSATYNRVFGLPTPGPVYHKLSTDDIALLSNLNDCVRAADTIITTLKNVSGQDSTDYYSFYKDYALSGGLNFTENVSKFFVPFPLGATMESLAVQYLGDANRWIEIAALNGLKEPYIDETGFVVPLTGNGSGSYITIADSSNLYVGEVITLSSNTQQATQFKVLGIDIVSSTQTVLHISGPVDAGLFRTEDGASFVAYMPNTLNSNSMLVAIPSLNPISTAGSSQPVPGVNDLNGLVRIAQVDFLLNSSGDLIINSSGDVALAIGLANLTQVALIMLKTPLGSIVSDPTFGNPVSAGVSTADINPTDVIRQLDTMFGGDPRFAGVIAANVSKNGPTCSITVAAKIANTNLILPLTTELPL